MKFVTKIFLLYKYAFCKYVFIRVIFNKMSAVDLMNAFMNVIQTLLGLVNHLHSIQPFSVFIISSVYASSINLRS